MAWDTAIKRSEKRSETETEEPEHQGDDQGEASVAPIILTAPARQRDKAGKRAKAKSTTTSPAQEPKISIPKDRNEFRPSVLPSRNTPKRRRLSSLIIRIFAPNLIALAVLVGGVFYLDQYRNSLLDAKLESLETQAGLLAAALSESAVTGPAENRSIDPYRAVQVVQRVAERAKARARLFNADSVLIADSRELVAAGRIVELRKLPSPGDDGVWTDIFDRFYNWVFPKFPGKENYQPYTETWAQSASEYFEAREALKGIPKGAVRSVGAHSLVITYAMPVQDLRQVVGVLLLSSGSDDIEARVRQARTAVLQAFAIALGLTFLISIFLARTIERPLSRLAEAADRVRRWRGQRVEIPDLSQRRDEIGELSGALRDMTNELYTRLDAIEAFAADVAHEIKNPLSSLRSAVESLPVAANPENRDRLIAIIQHDIQRLDRLISDISNASRLDSELVREEKEAVNLNLLLGTAIELHSSQEQDDGVQFKLLAPVQDIYVSGVASRLGQVIDNLLGNARSFSPANGQIVVSLREDAGIIEIMVEDDGPGIPEESLEAIFNRFYSKRPKQEAFGQHSGLGLSIVRQIIDAHGGTIHCENRRQDGLGIVGARFVIRLQAS